MVKAHTPRALALLICKAVYELKGSDLHWASVGEVSKKLGVAHSEAMNIALAYGSQEGLLACGHRQVVDRTWLGASLYAKRLEKGRFIWPSTTDGIVVITPGQLGYLLEGIDWRHPKHTWRPEIAG